MYSKIMVPLDGSKLAESVLPHVASVVKGCNYSEVVFVRVVQPVHFPAGATTDGGSVYSEEDARRDRKKRDELDIENAKTYLEQVLKNEKYANAQTSSQVLYGDPAKNLADYAAKNAVDLIVISTHGRSGISHLVWGSVAEKVLRNSCAPILMVRAPGCGPGS